MSGLSTLLLCVGATKAGTSWLYQHLRTHPDCHLRGVKELHYFDTIESGTFGRRIRLQRAAAERLALGLVEDTGPFVAAKARDAADWLQVLQRGVEDIPAYLSYLGAGAAGRLVADVTPANAVLPEARLRQMATMTADVRFLYILREPVSRLWSHVRMLAVRAASTAADVPRLSHEILARVLAGEERAVADRSDDAGAVLRLCAAVAPGRLAVMVQDEMLTRTGLARLWDFLGVGEGPARLDRPVHRGVEVALDADQAAAARAWLRPQYDFVEALLGRLPSGWRHPRSGVAA